MRRKISLRKLAKQVGVHPTYISKIELGMVSPPAWHRMLAISDVLQSTSLLDAGRRAWHVHLAELLGKVTATVDSMPTDSEIPEFVVLGTIQKLNSLLRQRMVKPQETRVHETRRKRPR
jgi:transcriptional regulator with XRE-family HTH domain